MRNFKLLTEQDDPETNGFSRHGSFACTPSELAAAFGQPTWDDGSSDGKVDRQYTFGDGENNFSGLVGTADYYRPPSSEDKDIVEAYEKGYNEATSQGKPRP